MNEKFFAIMLLAGVVLLIVGSIVVFSAMNQVVESPFITDVNSIWNAELYGLTTLMAGILLTLIGTLKIFKYM